MKVLSKHPPKSPRFAANPKVSRRERRSAETRERLFRAALDLFARKGFERVLYFRFLASNGNCVLVSAHVQLSPCN